MQLVADCIEIQGAISVPIPISGGCPKSSTTIPQHPVHKGFAIDGTLRFLGVR
jgi:hypothetical protein